MNKKDSQQATDVDASASADCYASGWRPEAPLKQVAIDMLAIIFDPEASADECQMAASTLVEAVYPKSLPQ
jgi:hypothetical protein